jgi:large subunit ribosomal protein L9|tara:strand:- start:707 stop:1159 length:453 start_codon:yes stop_codon:yes gene_type:complete
MKLILNSDVTKLGRKGDVVDVTKGYARNYLIPKNLAIVATDSNISIAEKIQEKRAAEITENKELAESIKLALADAHLVIPQKSTDEGTLYAAVGNNEIVEVIEKFSGFLIEEKQIDSQDQVKEIGLHNIKIKLSEDVDFDVVLEVIPETG